MSDSTVDAVVRVEEDDPVSLCVNSEDDGPVIGSSELDPGVVEPEDSVSVVEAPEETVVFALVERWVGYEGRPVDDMEDDDSLWEVETGAIVSEDNPYEGGTCSG